MNQLAKRLQECGLEIHPEKSRIIYCKDKNRKEEYTNIAFEFLGYAFRPRRCVNKKGELHPNFLLAISNTSKKAINREIRSWHVQLKSDKSLVDLSRMFNSILVGWCNYYGRYYPSGLATIWDNFNTYLIRWVRRKHKKFSGHKTRARRYINCIARDNPDLFIHWKLGFLPGGKVVGAV